MGRIVDHDGGRFFITQRDILGPPHPLHFYFLFADPSGLRVSHDEALAPNGIGVYHTRAM
jgi:hypothetical protein